MRPPLDDVFRERFGSAPTAMGDAPGRVNLLGEHTDYNDGFVLPIAIAQRTEVALRPSGRPSHRLYAAQLDAIAEWAPGTPPAEPFARYVHGCLVESERAGAVATGALDILVRSSVPIGVGLSSSAALEVATLRAIRTLTAWGADDVQLARVAQRAEVGHAGVRCGILDQMASSLADTDRALLLDTRSLERRAVTLPPGSGILVVDSGVSRSLAASGYNQRRAECEQAAALLGVASLRDLAADSDFESLPEPLNRRVRHVVTENARVLAAVSCGDASAFGALMDASHASLRDDYEVSTPALDRLVAQLRADAGVFGARLTGAGFGGACVALCRQGNQATIAAAVMASASIRGTGARVLVPPVAGT